MSFILCAEFSSLFPDDHQLGPVFTLSGMDFQDIQPSTAVSFVNLTDGVLGLQFPDSGLEVTFPVAVASARLRIGQFNAPFTVEGLDSHGAVVSSHTTTVPNRYYGISMSGPDLARLVFRGGGNEGVLVSVCIVACR
jgi:hypothetical protein